jgi:hypothetical protein
MRIFFMTTWRQGNAGADGGAEGRGIKFESAPELLEEFTHARDAQAGAGLALQEDSQGLIGYAAALIAHFQGEIIIGTGDVDGGSGAARMPECINQALFGDAVEGESKIPGESIQVAIDLQGHTEAIAAGKSIHIILKGGLETEFIQQGWVQLLGQVADVPRAILGRLDAVREQTFGLEGVAGLELVFEEPEADDECGQFLCCGIVQFTRESTALLVLESEQCRWPGGRRFGCGHLGLRSLAYGIQAKSDYPDQARIGQLFSRQPG